MKKLFEKNNIQITEFTWLEIKSEVKAVNPELFDIVEKINPKSNETFAKISYPFGSLITDNGEFNLPDKNGKLVPFSDSDLNPEIKNLFDYTFIPLGLLLNKGVEIFVRLDDRLVSLNMLPPGRLFGLFEAVDLLSGIKTKPAWCVSSGARSIFMLPKISDNIGHKKLKQKFGAIHAAPSTFEKHGEIFKTITAHSDHAFKWKNDVLFFTSKWFDFSKRNRFEKLYNYFFKSSHIQGLYAMNDTAIHLTWQNVLLWLGRRNLKPRPYLIDTLHRLINITIGTLPGFAVADHSEIFAPTKSIQDEYIKTYGLKKYLPTILYPEKILESSKTNTLYYSLSCPILYEGAPSHKSPVPIIDDLRAIKLMIDTMQDALKLKKFSIPEISKNLCRAQFEYFHTGKDIYSEIQDAKELINLDRRFEDDKKFYKKREVCTTSPFFTGVIKITIEK